MFTRSKKEAKFKLDIGNQCVYHSDESDEILQCAPENLGEGQDSQRNIHRVSIPRRRVLQQLLSTWDDPVNGSSKLLT